MIDIRINDFGRVVFVCRDDLLYARVVSRKAYLCILNRSRRPICYRDDRFHPPGHMAFLMPGDQVVQTPESITYSGYRV